MLRNFKFHTTLYDKIFKCEYQIIFSVGFAWIDVISLQFPSHKNIKQKINLQIFVLPFPNKSFNGFSSMQSCSGTSTYKTTSVYYWMRKFERNWLTCETFKLCITHRKPKRSTMNKIFPFDLETELPLAKTINQQWILTYYEKIEFHPKYMYLTQDYD